MNANSKEMALHVFLVLSSVKYIIYIVCVAKEKIHGKKALKKSFITYKFLYIFGFLTVGGSISFR